jgi:hypothetical protein
MSIPAFTLQQSSAFVERTIATAMIVSDRALRAIGLQLKPRYFTAAFAARVSEWCLGYQDKYGKAPGADIQVLFESHRRNGMPQDEAQIIGQFLSSISHEFEKTEKFNEQLAIDEALKYFHERALTLLRDDLDYHLSGGNVVQAHAAVSQFVAPAERIALGFEPLDDMEGMRAAFEDKSQLFDLPGDLGKMISSLERDNSVAVVGKFKATKSFTSQYLGFHALYSGLDVAWFDFEMGGRRIRRRIAQAICAMPLRPPDGDRLLIPVWDCKKNQSGECSRPGRTGSVSLLKDNQRPKWTEAAPGYRPCDVCLERELDTWFMELGFSVLDWRGAWQKAQQVAGSVMGAKLKVQSWPKFSAGLQDVRATLDVWRHLEGFNPDIIIVDQPSGMRLEGRGRDDRRKIDDLWKGLCALPQELHCLGIYPSQAGGKDAQERKRLRDSDVAEHVGILGHVDCTIKIDQDDVDKAAGRAWFSVGVERDSASPEQYCCVLQCLDLGQPVLDSRFR